jgi:hypothetical protein
MARLTNAQFIKWSTARDWRMSPIAVNRADSVIPVHVPLLPSDNPRRFFDRARKVMREVALPSPYLDTDMTASMPPITVHDIRAICAQFVGQAVTGVWLVRATPDAVAAACRPPWPASKPAAP